MSMYRVHGQASSMHTATDSSKHTYMQPHPFLTLLVPLPNITSPVGGYCTLAMQPYLCKVCWPMKYIILMFLLQANDEYAGACLLKKTHGRQSLALPDTVHNQEKEQPYFNINSDLLLSTQNSSRLCKLFRYMGDRERQCKLMYTFAVFCHIQLITYQDDRQLKDCSQCSLCMLFRSV